MIGFSVTKLVSLSMRIAYSRGLRIVSKSSFSITAKTQSERHWTVAERYRKTPSRPSSPKDLPSERILSSRSCFPKCCEGPSLSSYSRPNRPTEPSTIV